MIAPHIGDMKDLDSIEDVDVTMIAPHVGDMVDLESFEPTPRKPTSLLIAMWLITIVGCIYLMISIINCMCLQSDGTYHII